MVAVHMGERLLLDRGDGLHPRPLEHLRRGECRDLPEPGNRMHLPGFQAPQGKVGKIAVIRRLRVLRQVPAAVASRRRCHVPETVTRALQRIDLACRRRRDEEGRGATVALDIFRVPGERRKR